MSLSSCDIPETRVSSEVLISTVRCNGSYLLILLNAARCERNPCNFRAAYLFIYLLNVSLSFFFYSPRFYLVQRVPAGEIGAASESVHHHGDTLPRTCYVKPEHG